MHFVKLFCLTLLVISAIIYSQSFYHEVEKPVDVKDYDGTYGGISGTGSLGYSVLYRDNEDNGSYSGDVGEGWGSHPGVDILSTSGTSVKVIADGSVHTSENHASWGGLIVIKHDVGDIPGINEVVYSVYAHLKQRDVTSGDVDKGDVIGLSGGATSDPYHGNSTGAHLHFQIDRDKRLDNSQTVSHPYWPPRPSPDPDPTEAVVNIPDTNEVENATVNPMPFLKYRSYAPIGFHSDGWDSEDEWGAFRDAYEDDAPKIGFPFANTIDPYVHEWGDAPSNGVWIQDFHRSIAHTHFGTDGQTALILNTTLDEVFLVKEGFWGHYKENDGYKNLGAPEENEQIIAGGADQDFEKGTLVYTTSTGLITIKNTGGTTLNQYEVTIAINPPGSEIWHNGDKIGNSPVTEDLYEGFTYEYEVMENGYQVDEFGVTVGTSNSTEEDELTSGTGSGPENFPLTKQAEDDMEGLGTSIAGGMNLTSQNWYIGTQPWVFFSGAGWVVAEVKVKSGGQVGGEWPYLKFEAFGSIPPQEVNSTSWMSLYYLFEVAQSVDQYVGISIAEQSRADSGHSVDVDYVTFTYVPGDYIPPVANDDQSDVKKNVAQIVDLPANDTDNDSLDLTSVVINTQPDSGSVVVDTVSGKITYTPDSGFTGEDSLEYTIRDTSGIISKTGKAKVEVKRIVIYEPNGGESYDYGEWVDIYWWKDSGVSDFRVEYSIDDGENWTYVATVFDDTTAKFRNTKLYDEDSCLIRVKNRYDYDEYDLSDEYFTLEGLYGAAKIGVIVEGSQLPESYALYQNNPNPFNPTTKIRFDLPEDTHVRIDIFNILGQKVITLIDRELPAGQQSVIWQSNYETGGKAATGVYIYRMVTDKHTDIKKMIILK